MTGSRRRRPEPARELARARRLAGSVPDPELPMLTLGDLGILRDVAAEAAPHRGGHHADLLRLPGAARDAARDVAAAAGRRPGSADVRSACRRSAPPWSTDWITAGRAPQAGRGRDRAARPGPARRGPGPVPLTLTAGRADVACPACGCADTVLTAAFGATACQDLYRCRACARAVRARQGDLTMPARAVDCGCSLELTVRRVDRLCDDAAALTFAVPPELAGSFRLPARPVAHPAPA